jgi:hypothetical protein
VENESQTLTGLGFTALPTSSQRKKPPFLAEWRPDVISISFTLYLPIGLFNFEGGIGYSPSSS